MKIVKFAISRPIATSMIFLAILLLGFFSYSKLYIDFLPKIEAPAITILTYWQAASAQDVESKVTKVIENNVSIINNLDQIKSSSREGASVISCVFAQGTNLDEASNEIRARIEFAKPFLPDDLATPILLKFNTSMMPIIFYGVTAKEHFENLQEIIEDDLAAPLKRIEGVGAVQVIGGVKKEINIKLDREKLSAYNLTLIDIENALKQQNVSLPTGAMDILDKEYMLRLPSEFDSYADIENVVIKKNQIHLLRLKDVAEVAPGFKEQKYFVKINGENGIMLMVQKRAGSNTVEVAKKVREQIAKLQKNLPLDIKTNLIMDSSEFISRSVHNLLETFLWGTLFVAIVTFIFYRNIRLGSIIMLSLPFSIIGVFCMMYYKEWSLNIISLAAIAIATGMVVDNAIVVVDNIINRLQKKDTLVQAIENGTNEVGFAISASTISIIVVFLPLVFSSGLVSLMFGQLGWVVGITLLASLLAALMLTPMLASKLLKNLDVKKIDDRQAFFKKLENFYTNFLSVALKYRKTAIICAVVFFIGTFSLVPFIGAEFMPDEDSGDITINFELPVGTRVERTKEVCINIEKLGKEIIQSKNIINTYFRCGSQNGGMGAAFSKEGSNLGRVGFKLVKKDERDFSSKSISRKIVDSIKDEIVKIEVDHGNPMMRHMFGGAKPLSVEILGHDFIQTDKLASQIKAIVANVPGVKDPSISRDMQKPELVINVDREKAQSLGLTMASIGSQLRTLFHGKKATTFHQGEKDIDISLRLQQDQRATVLDVLNSEVINSYGKKIALMNVAQIEERKGPIEIERQNQERVVRVEFDAYQRSQNEVIQDVQKELKSKISVPSDISINFGGMFKEQKKAFGYLFMMFFLSLIMVYMVMAFQFESLRHPFVVMVSVPFALSGVLIALFLTHTTLNAISFIGTIMLIGIVANHTIILVDYTNLLRRQGINLLEAVLQAGKNRLRPVLVTTLTTIFGMLPLVLSRGEGSQMWKPLGIAVIGGLMFSTLITLIIVPTVYTMMERKKNI
ncbi:MAG: efflux RND transporter permease subunit [Chlamydiae bacterium]|nr:efflux RND transporter permease subunit [Chlamydiota bacterium]